MTILYNYFKHNYNYSKEELQENEITTEYAWMHKSCGYWHNIEYSNM